MKSTDKLTNLIDKSLGVILLSLIWMMGAIIYFNFFSYMSICAQ